MGSIPEGRGGFHPMLLRWGVVTALLVSLLLYGLDMPGKSHTGPLPPLSEAEVEIRDRLANHVQVLAGEIGERNLWHYASLLAAADYIEDTFVRLGYPARDEPYPSRGQIVRNLIAEIPGTTTPPGEIILIGAHYDSVRGSPGANDNASGVAALLELARLLAGMRLPHRVRFVAFVNEEPPFSYGPEMGSLVHAQGARARGEKIAAMLSLETIGYYSDEPGSQHYPFPLSLFYPNTANFIGFVGDLQSWTLVHNALGIFRATTAFPAEGAAVPSWIRGVGWSDHWSFWQQGYPGIMVTDTAFFRSVHYHTRGDTPEKVDYDRTARVVAGLARVITGLQR